MNNILSYSLECTIIIIRERLILQVNLLTKNIVLFNFFELIKLTGNS